MVKAVRINIEKNTTILVFTEVVGKFFGLALTILVARVLGVANFGLLNYAYALAGICLVVPEFGFDRLTVRELARKPSRASRFLVNISAVKAVLILPAAIVCALTIFFQSDRHGVVLVVMIVFLFMAIQNHTLFACSFFRAIQKMEREGLVRIILAFFLLLTGFAVLLTGFGLKALVISKLAVSVLCLGVAIFFIHKDLRVSLVKITWKYSKTLIGMAAAFAGLRTCAIIYTSANLVLLGFFKGDVETGYYAAAFKIISLFSIVSASVAGASLPVLSKYWKENTVAFHQTYQKAVRYLLVLAIPLAAGVFLLGQEAIVLVFGKEFIPSVITIKILAFSLVPDFLNTILMPTLISMNREKVALAATTVGAIVALAACIILIPVWGAKGAAFAWLIAETAVFFFLFCVLYRAPWVFGQLVTAIRATLSAGVMGIVLFLSVTIGIPPPFLVVISVLVYAGSLLALGEVKIHEIESAWEAFKDFIEPCLRRRVFLERGKYKE